jgi:DNA-binding MarR family transcriptional regulator
MVDRDKDEVGRFVGQWAAERPDLDLRTMATVARLLNVARHIQARLAAFAAEYGLSIPEGDVLFTLRRAGPPYRLAPSAIAESLLVPSGTMTNRLDRLENRGLIERVPHPTDRRSTEVQLTESGRELVDGAVTGHVANEQQILEPLSERDRATLDRLTSTLLEHLAAEDPPPGHRAQPRKSSASIRSSSSA